MKASELKEGEAGIIKNIESACIQKDKMIDFGIVNGARIMILKKLAFGDPILIKIRETLVALRKKDLSCVNVEGVDE
ncbi:MAG: FeoA domain-containing protein [Spirochaetales bacterium]|nr:FeoA domain-containing protein [Spirochaetales bacterium]